MANSNVAVVDYGPGNTTQIGGSRFALWGEDVINPVGWGQQWETKPYSFPTGIPMMGAAGNYGSPNGGASVQSSAQAIGNPLSFSASPLPWALVAIVVAVVGLHWLHWRKRGGGE